MFEARPNQAKHPPKFNIAPENGWLEEYIFSFGEGNFSGAMFNFVGVFQTYQFLANKHVLKKKHRVSVGDGAIDITARRGDVDGFLAIT